MGVLKEIYPRLFSISGQQEAKILEMGLWEGEGWKWNFEWKREFWTC